MVFGFCWFVRLGVTGYSYIFRGEQKDCRKIFEPIKVDSLDLKQVIMKREEAKIQETKMKAGRNVDEHGEGM